jgi:hypothetical protein
MTVVANVALRLFPGFSRWMRERLQRLAQRPPNVGSTSPRVQVIVPWKLMLIGSLVLTVVLNVLAPLGR